ncbi:MAG: VWA-like domain-containing protein [Pseudomonadota bacterium]
MSQLNYSSKHRDRRQSQAGAPARARLNAATQWNGSLQRYRSRIIQSDEAGLPRYGVLSVLARRVPFHLYDHPALTALCDTAFTDGIHVFVNTEFFVSLLDEDAAADAGSKRHDSLLLILLHELSHILYRHHGRMPPGAPPLLWAIACDIAINVRLLRAYPALRPGPVFDSAWGTATGDYERYLGQSEEHILYSLWEDPPARDRAFIEALKAAQRSPSNAIDEQLDERGRAQGVHRHLVSPQALARRLQEQGLGHVRQELQLPLPGDQEGFQRLDSLTLLRLASDVDRARELREAHPSGSAVAGSHIDESYGQWIENERGGRLQWKTLLRDLLLGDGMRYEPCDELPNDIFYVDPECLELEAPLYASTLLPAAPAGVLICVIDTSASVSAALLKTFVAEINGLIDEECVPPQQLYLVNADTTIREDIRSFSDHPIAADPERVRLEGRGGTDMARALTEVLRWGEEQTEFAGHDCRAIIYFTDLLDRAPAREMLPEDLPELLFLTPPGRLVTDFRNRVRDFATVAEIRDGTVIDLCLS